MSFFNKQTIGLELPLLNSASPWASSREDLEELWRCEFTQAITTRTSTLEGYPDDPRKHQVAFFGQKSAINSFGFSPHPLSQYLDWLRAILSGYQVERTQKTIIISIGASQESELDEMLALVAAFAHELGVCLGVEFNASCPNLNGSPPPAYVPSLLESYLQVFSRYASRNLQIGIKLPPYTYEEQLVSVVRTIAKVSMAVPGSEPIVSFLTSTNTLGQGLVFASQIVEPADSETDSIAQRRKPEGAEFGVPTGYGGLSGEAIHQISLGNVHRLRHLLDNSEDPRVRSIRLIGVGGVCDAASAARFRRAGADAVAVATALGREGVSVFERIRKEAV
ncbi:hypothetical protein JCM16303_006480 [Sporobolomyces ruberrimus]